MASSPARSADSKSLEVLGKLSNEDAEKVGRRNLISWINCSLCFSQFVHEVINGVCEKRGPRYETFAKSFSLAHFSRLVRCVETAVKAVGREGGSKEQVYTCMYMCVCPCCKVSV